MAGVYGYSVSAIMSEPRSAVTDEQANVSITRLGQRVRISGGLELGGALDKRQAASLYRLYRGCTTGLRERLQSRAGCRNGKARDFDISGLGLARLRSGS